MLTISFGRYLRKPINLLVKFCRRIKIFNFDGDMNDAGHGGSPFFWISAQKLGCAQSRSYAILTGSWGFLNRDTAPGASQCPLWVIELCDDFRYSQLMSDNVVLQKHHRRGV